MNIEDIEYERLLHEDYITDVEINRVIDTITEEENIKYKNSNNLSDRREHISNKGKLYKNKLLAAIHNTPEYKYKVRDMGERERILFDKEISKQMSAYFPSIKEYWIKNNCSGEILTQYALSTFNQALGMVSLEKVRKHKLSEASFMDRDNFVSEEYNITKYPKMELYKEESHKKSLSEIIDESAYYNDCLESINEVNQNAIKKKSDNFLAMIKRMAQKFIAYARKQMGQSKNYLLNKKEDILRKKPGENIPIEMRNYGTGIKNIMTSAIPQFEAIKDSLPGDKVACENALKQRFVPAYNDFNIDFKQWCVAYFEGGSQKVKTNINALNMNEIYSFVSTYDTRILPIIQRDLNILEQLGNAANKIGSNIANAERQQQIQKVRDQQNANSAPGIRRESYLMEAPQTPPPQTGAAPANGTPAGDKMVIGKQQGEIQNTNTPATASQQQQQNQVQNANKDNLKLDVYKKVGFQYIGAKMTAASTIYKDYMTILRTHAPEKSYAGNASTGLNIQDPKGTLQQIAAIQSMKDRNKQNKMIQDLIASVQQNNPGFNGGLNDISTAANMALKNGG